MEPETPEQPSPDQNPESVPKKRIKDLPLEQRREYQRLAKQRSRERQRRSEIPLASDYSPPKEWERDLSKFSDETVRQVQAEIGPVTEKDKYVITGVAETTLGIEKNFLQKVEFPSGTLAGMWFIDALAAEAVNYVHQNPALLQSETFRALYHKTLVQIVKWARKADPDTVSREFIGKIERELQ